MMSLTHSSRLLKKAVDDFNSGDGDRFISRVSVDEIKEDAVAAALRHISGTHITTTYPDGSSGRKEAVWHPRDQYFTDWGNNYWLHGPKSFLGERSGGKWVLQARNDHEVMVKAILDRAALHSKHVQLVQRMWSFYWQLLLMEVTRHNDEATIDLHLQPLDVESLAPRPELRYNLDNGRQRIRDRILV